LKPPKRYFDEAVIFSAGGATGLKPGVERSGTPGTDLRADERWRRKKISSARGDRSENRVETCKRRIVQPVPTAQNGPSHVQGTCSCALGGHQGTKPAAVLTSEYGLMQSSNFRWPRRSADVRSTRKTSIAPFAY